MRREYLASSSDGRRLTSACLRPAFIILLFVLAAFAAARAQAQGEAVPARAGSDTRTPQTYTREGVSVELSVEPLSGEKERPARLLAGTEAVVRFRVFEANAGKPLTNLRPAAWLDRREGEQATGARECREKVQSFLQPTFSKRPTSDLNSYYILALNREPSISVIDPLSGFAGSRLFTLVALSSPGEDWALSDDRKRLYVSMPLSNQVAVVDATTWKTVANLDAGPKPTRVALQHDGRYLWVGNDAAEGEEGGVTVIDTVTLRVAARLKTGAGHHEIAFADDDSLAFVTNRLAGTLSVVDVRKLSKVADVKVGALPSSLAFSTLGKAVYVASEGDGTIAAVGGPRHELLAVMKAQPGLRAVRLMPDGRFGFALNRATSTVFVFDVTANRIVHAVPVGQDADQITFTRQFAYVRAVGSEFVTMIKLNDLGREAAVTRFPAGQKAPKESPAADSLADAIVPALEEGAVLVANPADKMIYYYAEGMAAPMGSFQNYERDPKALLVLDKGLREGERGVYSTTVRLADPGHYDVVFLLDSPRLVNCFDIAVAENPSLPKQAGVAIKVVPLQMDAGAHVGEPYSLRFKVTDAASNQPKTNLEDLSALVFLAPGVWQQRGLAKHVGSGVYEISFVPPEGGVYYLFFQCPSLGVRFNQITPFTLRATKR